MNTGLNIQLIVILMSVIRQVNNRDRLLFEWEVAHLLGVSDCTLARWRKAKQIGHVALSGGDIRYRREDVDAFLTDRHVEPMRRRGANAIAVVRQGVRNV